MTIFCFYGFADTLRESKYERVIQWDFHKVKRYLAGTWPKPIGERIDFETDAGGVPSDIAETHDFINVRDPRGGGTSI